MKKPTRVKCLNCNDVIYSMFPGDFVTCCCYKQSQDIINDKYLEALINKPDLEENWKENHKVRCDLAKKYGTGIYIDETDNYIRAGGSSEMEIVE